MHAKDQWKHEVEVNSCMPGAVHGNRTIRKLAISGFSGSYPGTVQAVVHKIQAVVLKPSKMMLTCHSYSGSL